MSETEDDQTAISNEPLPTANIEESDEELKDSLHSNISNIGQTVVVSAKETDKDLKDSPSLRTSDVVHAERDDSDSDALDDDD